MSGSHPTSRRWRALASLLLLAPLAFVGLRLYLSGPSVRDAVHLRVRQALEPRVGEVTLGERFAVGWLGTVELGPLELGGSGERGPVVRVERVRASPRLVSFLRGRLELERVVLEGIRIVADREGLLRLARRIRSAPGSEAPASSSSAALPRVELRQLSVVLGKEEIGPFSGWASLSREARAQSLSWALSLPDKGSVRGEVRSAQEGISASATAADLPLAALLRPFREQLPVSVGAGTLGGSVELTLEEGGRRASGSAGLELSGLTVEGERLASEPVGPLRARASGSFLWDRAHGRLELESLRFSLGEADALALVADAHVLLGREPQLSLSGRVQDLDVRRAIAALPPALAPPAEAPAVEGTLSAKLELKGPLRHPEEWALSARLDLRRLRAAGGSPLSREFVHVAHGQVGEPRSIVVGPSNPRFVPLEAIPPVLVKAVLLSEDSMFFTHQGFDFGELKNNLVAEASGTAKVLRGGSTLTQQLAKNLFLSRERTYARKVREAFVTLALEATVPKERLLEIYLNLIEWGPGLFGIGEAADHYFAKAPRDLTVKEAAFLASIIPNPVRFHGYCSKGALTEAWERRLSELLLKMHGAGAISDQQLEEATHGTLTFHHR